MTVTRKDVESKIASVTVYENRAQVHRVAAVELGSGVTSLVFSDIPQGVDRDSIQVGLRILAKDAAPDAVALNGITFEARDAEKERKEKEEKKKAASQADDGDAAAAAVAEVERTFEEKIEAVEDEIVEINARLVEVASELEMVTTYFEGATTSRSNEEAEIYDSVDHWQKLIDAKIGSDAAAVANRRAVEAELKAAQGRLAELKADRAAELRKLRPAPASTLTTPLMLVHLATQDAVGAVEVLVSYMMSNATWRAAYDVRVNMKTGTASVTYHALVSQRTGETWGNVNLTMSTAKPAVSGRAPDLSRWYATVFEPRVAHTKSSSMMRKSKKGPAPRREQQQFDGMLDEEEDEAELDSDSDGDAAPAEPARFETAEVSDESKTALSFDVPHQHTVPSNNDPVRVSLTVIALTPEFTYATRPSAAEVVYGILNATNPSNFTIMPGDANVFVDGQFITKSSLSRIAPKSNLRIGIGQESAISVVYKALKQEDSETGGMLQTKKRVRNYFRQVIVKNQRDSAVDIRVEHEMPTAEDSRVEVTLVEPEAKTPHLENRGDGKFALLLKMKPREERKVSIQIAVSYPQDMTNLQGL